LVRTRQITGLHLGRRAFRLLSVAVSIFVETGLNGKLRIGLMKRYLDAPFAESRNSIIAVDFHEYFDAGGITSG
jgi:hypothetical protein